MASLPFKLTHQRFPPNERGRDLVVGDIHGHFEVLESALGLIDFDPDNDRLFALGDLVDRGERSGECVHWLAEPWFHSILGNHEISHVLDGYGEERFPELLVMGEDFWIEDLSPAHYRQMLTSLAALPVAITLESSRGPVGLLHAHLPSSYPQWADLIRALDDDAFTVSDLNQVVWARPFDLSPDHKGEDSEFIVPDVVALLHGHSVPLALEPFTIGNRYFIETGTFLREMLGEGGMTIVDIEGPEQPLLSAFYPG